MNRTAQSIAARLSLRPPQTRSLDILAGIAKASPLMAHLANKYFNDISHADVANTKCERSAHTAAVI